MPGLLVLYLPVETKCSAHARPRCLTTPGCSSNKFQDWSYLLLRHHCAGTSAGAPTSRTTRSLHALPVHMSLQWLSSARPCIYWRLRSIQGGHDYSGITELRGCPPVFKPWPVPDVRPVISTTLRARLKAVFLPFQMILKAVFSGFSDENGPHLAKKSPAIRQGITYGPRAGPT